MVTRNSSKLRTGSSKSLKSWSQSSSRSKRDMKRERKRRREEERKVNVERGEEEQGGVVLQLKKQRVERATTISQSRVGYTVYVHMYVCTYGRVCS